MSIPTSTLPVSLALAMAGSGAVAAADVAGPEQTVQHFIAAGDRRDETSLAELLHPQFRVLFVTKGKAGESGLSRAQYLELVHEKKLGGDERKVEIVHSEVSDRLAFVRARVTGKQAVFEILETLVLVDQRWQLVSDQVVFAPLAKTP